MKRGKNRAIPTKSLDGRSKGSHWNDRLTWPSISLAKIAMRVHCIARYLPTPIYEPGDLKHPQLRWLVTEDKAWSNMKFLFLHMYCNISYIFPVRGVLVLDWRCLWRKSVVATDLWRPTASLRCNAWYCMILIRATMKRSWGYKYFSTYMKNRYPRLCSWGSSWSRGSAPLLHFPRYVVSVNARSNGNSRLVMSFKLTFDTTWVTASSVVVSWPLVCAAVAVESAIAEAGC